MFDLLNNEIPNVEDTYPPYDIVRRGEESYRVRRREHVSWKVHDVNFSGLKITKTNLQGASISESRLDGMSINGILVTELVRVRPGTSSRIATVTEPLDFVGQIVK